MLSVEEQRVYDRQIRTWGLDAQHRMRNSHILVIGRIGGLAAEICKNLTLAGVGALTVCDNIPSTIHTLSSNFLASEVLNENNISSTTLTEGEASISALKQLNGNVVIVHMKKSFDSAADITSWLDVSKFTCIIGCGVTIEYALRLNDLIRLNGNTNTHFIYCDIDNRLGLSFFDLNDKFQTIKQVKAVTATRKELSAQVHSKASQKDVSSNMIEISYPDLYTTLNRIFSVPQSDSNVTTPKHSKIISTIAESNRINEPLFIATIKSLPNGPKFYEQRADIRRATTAAHFVRYFVLKTLQTNATKYTDIQCIPPKDVTNVYKYYPECLELNHPVTLATQENIQTNILTTINEKQKLLNETQFTADNLDVSLGLEFGPFCAIFGGVVAQEILKTFQKQSNSIQAMADHNLMYMNLYHQCGRVEPARIM